MQETVENQLSNGQTASVETNMAHLLLSPLIQKSICIAAELGIADMLAENTQTSNELAARTGMDASSVFRVMRALVSVGVFNMDGDGKFALTPLSEPLRSDHPKSMRDYAIMLGSNWFWSILNELKYSVETGKAAHPKRFGMEIFDYLEKNKEIAEIFNRAMTSITLMAIPAILKAYDFSSINTVVDIGGGKGSLLAGILKASPHVKGILFDLPIVIENAAEIFIQERVQERANFVPGNFFDSVPAGGDVYLLKFVIHDWPDDDCIAILKNIALAMNKTGKLLIVESVIFDGEGSALSKIRDLLMLTVAGGKERTEAEYRSLVSKAGLKLVKIIKTQSPFNLIECEPA